MKKILVIASVLLAGLFAQAQDGQRYYESIEGTVTDVYEMCPTEDGAICVINGTVVEIEYGLPCHQDLVSFEYDVIEVGDELHVFANAVVTGVVNNGPVCLAFSNVKKTLQLYNKFGNVVLHNLGSFFRIPLPRPIPVDPIAPLPVQN